MLALSILYVEANLAGHLDELFYGLTAAVGALVARALVRLSRHLHHRRPAGPDRGRGLRPDAIRLDASFVLVLLGAGLVYELWTNGERWTAPSRIRSRPPRRP